MKNIIVGFSLLVSSIFTINAQEISDHAIGLRLGSNDGFGSEISYQRKLKENNRLEVNLGLRDGFSDLKLTGLYQWVWTLEEKFNWYAGAGAGLFDSGGVGIFASGIIGVEYNFNAPILLSLDYRPEIGLINTVRSGLNSDIALSVRYQF